MPVIKSYYETTPIDEATLIEAIKSCKDQENKIYHIYKKYVCMTSWDVYDVYNELIGPIQKTSVGRSIHTLEQNGVIEQIGTIPNGDSGRPVFLYRLINADAEKIERRLNTSIPKTLKLDIVINNSGKIDIEKMIEQLDNKLNLLSETFNL